MQTHGHPSAHRPQPSGVNPFARALAEARGAMGQDDGMPTQENTPSTEKKSSQEVFNPAEQQRQVLEQQRRERMRQELHRRVNPVDQKDIFDSRKQQVKQELEAIRHELELLTKELDGFAKDIEVAVMSNIVEVGESGKGAKGYFAKLKEFIILIRQKVHSARTWATTLSGKKSKQAGLNFKAKGHSQTKNVWDTMHHERQLARAGG
ncbi:hypothetical protein H3C66_04445 [Patescibacteria group bacterium]|nr:hypothetical protein [Patescibacteria group bacterium]